MTEPKEITAIYNELSADHKIALVDIARKMAEIERVNQWLKEIDK